MRILEDLYGGDFANFVQIQGILRVRKKQTKLKFAQNLHKICTKNLFYILLCVIKHFRKTKDD